MIKLKELKDNHNWHTVLIDFTYATIEVFEESGLDQDRDLGEDSEEWMMEDLFSYSEMTGEDIYNLVVTNKLMLS